MTLELLHVEYLEQHPTGYRYTQFCEYYRRWAKQRKLSMRQVYRAGEKTFVDYTGMKPTVVDRSTGEVREVEVFVAALGASSMTYAEATETQRTADFIASHTRTFEYFGGVSQVVVPDQLESGVTKACRYAEPEPSLGSSPVRPSSADGSHRYIQPSGSSLSSSAILRCTSTRSQSWKVNRRAPGSACRRKTPSTQASSPGQG